MFFSQQQPPKCHSDARLVKFADALFCDCAAGWSGRDCSCKGASPPAGWVSCAKPPAHTPAPTPFPTPTPPALDTGDVHVLVSLELVNTTCSGADIILNDALRDTVLAAFAAHANVASWNSSAGNAVSLAGAQSRTFYAAASAAPSTLQLLLQVNNC